MGTQKSQPKYIYGIVSAVASALLFGISPVFVKIAYWSGSNEMMVILTRALVASPLLYVIAKYRKIDLRVCRHQYLPLFLYCVLGNFATTISLYASYKYIDVGVATVLHYIFPVIVMLVSVLWFGEKFVWWKTVSLLLGLTGVTTFISTSDDKGWMGITLALFSGITYAGLLISVERSVLKSFHFIKLTFYSNFIVLFCVLVTGIFTRTLNFSMTYDGWLFSILVAVLTGVGAFSLLNLSVRICGASTTSIIAMLEPLSGIFFGYIILRETISNVQILGCALIIIGVLLVSYCSTRHVPITK